PAHPRPRWGYGLPPHPRILSVLEGGRSLFRQSLEQVADKSDVLGSISYEPDPTDATRPFWNNEWFTGLDAVALTGFLTARAPATYLEIGSGFSTMFARHAVRANGLRTKIVSLDPRPRTEIDALCDQVIRRSLEDCDLAMFDALAAGDVLFF